MVPKKALLIAVLQLLPSVASAQKQATTLEVLTRRAPVILRITVTTTQRRGNELVVAFAATEALRGKLTVAPVLREPFGRHCGGSCHGLAKGQELVKLGVFTEGTGFVAVLDPSGRKRRGVLTTQP